MSRSIETFFEAWGVSDPDARADALRASLSDSISYLDPRTPDAISDANALIDYVGMFAAQAPGATAQVVNLSQTGPFARATVAFVMPGGMTQHGQYFIETDDQSRPTRMVGFVGLGEPE